MGESAEGPFTVVVAELADLVPRRVASLPNVFVAVERLRDPTELERQLRRRVARWGKVVRLMRELNRSNQFELEANALQRRDAIATRLAKRGYTVNPAPAQPRSLYVLELAAEHSPTPGHPWLYVGETGLPVDDRIANHLSGKKASRAVAKHFRRRRPDLEPKQQYFSVWDARAEETLLGLRLQQRGFVVTGPQGLS